jgi:hypothetical protein
MIEANASRRMAARTPSRVSSGRTLQESESLMTRIDRVSRYALLLLFSFIGQKCNRWFLRSAPVSLRPKEFQISFFTTSPPSSHFLS